MNFNAPVFPLKVYILDILIQDCTLKKKKGFKKV